ncbi:MAG: ABC transporter permease [Desulfurococcaceae archaeon]
MKHFNKVVPKIELGTLTNNEKIAALLRHGRGISGISILLIIIFLATAADFLSTYKCEEVDPASRLLPPSFEHPFGTDHLGRDVFTRLIHGARIAIWVGILVVLIEAVIGVPLGLIAGYYNGLVDKFISALTDMIWALPPIVLALAIITILGPGLTNAVIAVAAVSWAPYARIVRAKTQSLVSREFVLAARAIGEDSISIMLRYILPNLAPSIVVLATLTIPSAILYTTALSFLGLGAQPPTPDWGAMLSEAKDYILIAPWCSVIPGIFITITALGFNLLGDALRDSLDPKLKVG